MKKNHQNKKEINLLFFAFIVIAILAIASKTVGFYQIETIHKTTSDLYEHPLKVSNSALKVKLGVYKIHRDMKDVVLSSSDQELLKFIKRVDENEKQVYENLNIIEKKILGEKGLEFQKETKKLFTAWKPIRDEVITLIKNEQRNEAIAITKGKGHEHTLKLEEASLKLYTYAQNKATEFKNKSHSSFDKLRFINVEVSILLLLLFILVVYFTIKRTSSYLHKNEHLTDVLSLVRDVNQIIIREKELKDLLQKSCDTLASSYVYGNAWIITFDDANNINQLVGSDDSENFISFKKKVESNWTPHCVEKTEGTDEFYSSIEDILNNCPNCPLMNFYNGKSAFNIALKYEKKLYGYLNISINKEYLNDKDEISLLNELARDIAYAINNIRLESILKDSNERYRTLFKGNKATELIIDANSGKIVDCNEKALQFYGYSYEQLTSMHINEINILTEEEVAFEIKQAKEENIDKFNFRHRLANGEIKDVEVYSGPIEFEKETLLYSIIFDVTERRQLEEYKKNTQEQLKLVLEGSRDGIWDWDLVNNTLYFSPRWKEILGYTDDELENTFETWDSLLHPDDKEQTFFDVKMSQEGKTDTYRNINRLKHKDGHWVWIEARGQTIFDENNKPIRMIGSHTDITKEKEYENTILQIKELYGNIISSVDNLIFVKDTNLAYIACNSAFEKFMGKSKDEIIGKNDYDFFEKEIADFFRGYDKKMLAVNEAKSNFEWVTYPDGSQVYLLTTKSPLVDSNGNISGLVGNSVDVTEQQHVLERLKEAQALAKLGSWEYDLEKDKLIATEEIYNIYGFTDLDMELEKDTFYKQVHPDDLEASEADFQHSLHSKGINISHNRIMRKSDGEIRHLEHRWKAEYKDDVAIKTTGTTQDITEQKQIEQELLENETRFRSIFSQTFQFAGIIDLEGKVISVNNVSLEFIDAKESDLVGKLFIDTPWWEHSKDLREWLTKSIAKASNGETIQGEVTHYSKDGELHYFDFSLKPVVDEEEKVQYLVAESRDITDSKIAKETLAESNRQLLAFMDNLPGMAYRCKNDDKWSMEFISEGCFNLTGHKPNDVMNNKKISFLEVIHPEDRDKVWEDVQNGLKKEGNFESEYRITTASGETKWVWEHGLGIYDEDNNVIALEGVIIDNEARKHAEQELLISNSMLEQKSKELETIFNEAPDPMAIHDENGNILMINKAWEEKTGWKHEEINTIDKWTKKVAPTTSGDRKEHIKNLYAITEKIDEGEFEITTKSGEKLIWSFSSGPLKTTNEGTRILISSAKDVTELKHKDDLIMMQSRHAAMGEMIGMIAHQWRQPISIIAMAANNVLLDIALDSFDATEAEKFSQSILNQTSHLSKTIDDFRNFFKPDREVSKIKLQNIIEETVTIVNNSLVNNSIELQTSFESDSEVDAYPRELMQVFVNIINNAKDAMLSSGIEKPIIKIKVYDDDKYVNTEICDNGNGIDLAVLPKIFDPYFTTKDEKTGTGLGLYMSKMIIEDHLKGVIEACNKEHGACFRVRLLK
ncbi:sensory transduction histidine kinase [Sulfurimonas gotlandica GD1]|uniref:histidine kinase n=1 Tax=Sulfurimonas gotlandica (strain DSM 19862 / JCM 16533 / GD1) TaxID=929558 RepID=B6BNZ8_SULGG|nr:PAS domain S-box protein [Sulfurimonas gotlandica]EDZ61157.1 multi-sensor signal transduction histidine kinase [Sulfurimonas gotlandica GD1]EHP29222.1 sensory transduction histidine kinase [Sulfurimonas gotlandica GD1]